MIPTKEKVAYAFSPEDVVLDYSKGLIDNSIDPFIQRMNGKTYYDPWLGIDYRPNPWMANNRALQRAMWTYASSSQTVPTILPTFLDPDYIYAVPSDAPALASLPHKASLGAMASYVRITALGNPTSYWIAENSDSSTDDVAPTPERKNIPKCISLTRGGTSGFHRAAGESFKDMLAEAIKERLMGFITNGLEDGILNGNGSSQNAGGVNPTGLLTWQGTTNGVNASSAAVTIAQIQQAIRTAWVAGGDLESYGYAITDPSTYDSVKNLLIEYLGYTNIENYTLPWGLKTFEVQGVPFIRSRKMPTGSNVKKILFVDRRTTYLDVLQDVTTELLAKISDAQEFHIKFYGTPVNKAPEFGAVVYGIA